MFFSKRAFNILSSSSRFFGDNSFLLFAMCKFNFLILFSYRLCAIKYKYSYLIKQFFPGFSKFELKTILLIFVLLMDDQTVNIEATVNGLKALIYHGVTRLRYKFYVKFEEDEQSITLTWYIDYSERKSIEECENYSARAICEHELTYMLRFVE